MFRLFFFLWRLDWNATSKQATFSIDQNYDGGTFTANTSFVLDGSDNGFDIANSYLFIGGGQGMAVDDISVAQLSVPLTPGTIGNSQHLYLDEDPEPFTSVAAATGNGAIAYQWEWKTTGAWVNISGATGATYDSPVLGGEFTESTEMFVRRKATDDFASEYSNEASLMLTKVFSTSGTYLFFDNLNTGDTGNMNQDYATRQAGGGGTSPYTDPSDNFSISGNKLKNAGEAGLLSLDANMARYLVGEDFELSFKLTVPDSSGMWSSLYVADTPAGRNTSRFGLVAFGGASANAFEVYKGTSGGMAVDVITVAEMTTLLGRSYNKAEEHTIQLISKAGSGGTNTYRLVVDGVVIKSNIEYAFSNDTLRSIEVTGQMAGASAGALYDDIAIRYSPTFVNWSEKKGLSGADAERDADPDGDGLNNLAEYALGGNPSSADDAARLPVFEVTDGGGGSNFVEYIYNRRRNAASLGLTYGLNINTNLTGAWEYVGMVHETDAVGIDLDFESVTNSVPFGTGRGFIQLKITEE